MGSWGQTLLKMLPGAAETAAGVATKDPALMTAGGSSMLGGATSGKWANTQSPDQQIASALAGNPSMAGLSPNMAMGLGPGSPALAPKTRPNSGVLGQMASPLLATAGTMMTGGGTDRSKSPSPFPPPSAPQAAPPVSPATPNSTVGAVPTPGPLAALAKYRQFLAGVG